MADSTPPPAPPEQAPLPGLVRFFLVVFGVIMLGAAVWAWDGGLTDSIPEGVVGPVATAVGLAGIGLIVMAARG